MYRSKSWTALAFLGGILLTAGCNDADSKAGGPLDPDPSLRVTPGTTYKQVEFLGNPLVSEVTVPKSRHQGYNSTMPYLSEEYVPITKKFITGFGRPQALADLISTLLYNGGHGDMLLFYPDRDPATTGWLTWALQPGVGAGGRKLTDDVVDLGLTAIFSSFLNPTGAVCQPFQLPLCTDNVNSTARAPGATFPYLADPF